VIYVGVDWAEAHNDACVMAEDGVELTHLRIADTLKGVERLHAVLASHVSEPGEVVIGIETARGLVPQALVAAGYQVYAVNPFATSRYRDRHTVSRAKSDRGDAKLLADMVRTDRHNHRRFVGDSELAAAVKVLARSHRDLGWARQRHLNQLRNALRDYYPGLLATFSELGSAEALTILAKAPTPAEGRALSLVQIRAALRQAGRERKIDIRAKEIQDGLRATQLEAPTLLAKACGRAARSSAAIIAAMTAQIATTEADLVGSFEAHPDAKILRSLPGLGVVLGARVLAEFGDEPTRFADGRARKNYAATSPITRASGIKQAVVVRKACGSRLRDACTRWAFCSLTASPGARHYYDEQRSRGKRHYQALRAVANRWVGILHVCVERRTLYSETIAWPTKSDLAA
jgi:Transposase/Transposase IS116/IS110/IS902 family